MIGAETFVWIADALVILGCAVMTVGVVGIIRMPDIYSKLHAASKSVFLGVCSILVAAAALGDASIAARAALIFVLLLLTTPVAAYEMARSAVLEQRASSRPLGKTSPPAGAPNSAIARLTQSEDASPAG